MNTRVQDLLFFDRDTAVAVPTYETRRHNLFGIWSHAILGETRGFLTRVMSFASVMMTPTKEYVLLADPKLEDIHLEESDAVRWNRKNIPAELRTELGSGVMRVLSVAVVSSDDLIICPPKGKRRVPVAPYSKTPVAQITAQSADGRLFIAPNYYFERA